MSTGSEERREVKVMGVYMHQEAKMPAQHFVLLRDDRGRRMPIWMGQFEAWAISFALEGEPSERPLTHEAALLMLAATGATVREVAIDDLRNETFYSKLTLAVGDQTHTLDLRPSDAIAFALRTHCPIYMTETVIVTTARKE